MKHTISSDADLFIASVPSGFDGKADCEILSSLQLIIYCTDLFVLRATKKLQPVESRETLFL